MSEIGMAVLHGYDPKTGKTTSDLFREDDKVVTSPSPHHRARAVLESVKDDFPGWLWSVGANDRGLELMKDENLRRWGFDPEEFASKVGGDAR